MRIAYVVSRFPHVSETFIVRELNALSESAEVEIELFSLFPARSGTVHGLAERWIGLLHRGRAGGALAGLAFWLARRPLRMASILLTVLVGYGRRPALAARALVTAAVASQHARTLRGMDIEHLHAHYATYPALAAWVCRRLLGVPYSFTAHAHDLYVDQSMLARKVGEARFVVAISEFNRRFLAAYGAGDGGTPVRVVHCGVDLKRYEFRPRTPPARGPVPALCVASLQPYKGHAVLLRALASSALARVRLELVGDGELRAELERLARSAGIGNRVEFAGGRTESEVRASLERADLFVLPSVVADDGQMEGLPVVLMEALACGVPAVATRLSGIPELIVDGETGLLATPGDPGSLAAALERTLADPEATRRRAERGRAAVESGFDLRQTGERMAALFRWAVSGSSAPPPR